MKIEVKVVLAVDSTEEEMPVQEMSQEQLLQSIEAAVENALLRAQEWGFVHRLEDLTSICVEEVSASVVEGAA